MTGTVGGNGGTVSRLYFTVVGDTRPANVDDTSGYPTAIIDQIYTDITALEPSASILGFDGRLPVREPIGYAVRDATRSLPRGARQIPRRLLSGTGQPRVYRRDGVELRLGKIAMG